jgi:hypothetical protein
VSASIEASATGVTTDKLELRFDEVVAERPSGVGGSGGVTLESIVLVSPRTGATKVDWNRESITIEPRGGFKPNTTYRITVLPGLADLRGNVNRGTLSYVFSTGSTISPYGIVGRVFDWIQASPAPGAIVEAIANAGTSDSAVYITAADTLGQFDIGPLAPGRYLVRTFIDADRNRDRGVLEKWDTVTVSVTDHRPSIELLAAQRDSAPVGVQSVNALDSVWVTIVLDKPYDPRAQLLPSMIGIRRSDSSIVQVEAVMDEARAAVLRRPSDSTAAQRPAAPPSGPPPMPSARPLEARPSMPAPRNTIFVRVNPLTPLRTGERYALTVRAIPNLVGRIGSVHGVFEGPRPPAARPPGSW